MTQLYFGTGPVAPLPDTQRNTKKAPQFGVTSLQKAALQPENASPQKSGSILGPVLTLVGPLVIAFLQRKNIAKLLNKTGLLDKLKSPRIFGGIINKFLPTS